MPPILPTLAPRSRDTDIGALQASALAPLLAVRFPDGKKPGLTSCVCASAIATGRRTGRPGPRTAATDMRSPTTASSSSFYS